MPAETVAPDKKPRRRKAKRAEPTTPRRPRTTLKARIAAMSPTHLAAFKTLVDGNADFEDAVRDALRAQDDFLRAGVRSAETAKAAREAVTAYDAAMERARAGRLTIAVLDTLARQIATARGDVPATDDAHAATVAPASDAD